MGVRPGTAVAARRRHRMIAQTMMIPALAHCAARKGPHIRLSVLRPSISPRPIE